MDLTEDILINIPSCEECKNKHIYLFGKWYPLIDLYHRYGEGLVCIKNKK